MPLASILHLGLNMTDPALAKGTVPVVRLGERMG